MLIVENPFRQTPCQPCDVNRRANSSEPFVVMNTDLYSRTGSEGLFGTQCAFFEDHVLDFHFASEDILRKPYIQQTRCRLVQPFQCQRLPRSL